MEKRVTMAGALTALREEEITFKEFVRATDAHWDRLSNYVLRRWDVPPWVGAEDVKQDLLIAGWLFVKKFDPEKGVTLLSYVRFNAIDKAKKSANHARGVRQGGDHLPSRYERSVSSLAREGEDDDPDLSEVVEATQDVEIESKQTFARMRSVCGSLRELLTVQAIEDSGIDLAAKQLYEDADARRLCRIKDDRHAVTVVRESLRQVAARMEYLA